MGEGGGGEEKGKFLSFTSLPFSLPFFPFSPETPDTQATCLKPRVLFLYFRIQFREEMILITFVLFFRKSQRRNFSKLHFLTNLTILKLFLKAGMGARPSF